MFFKDIARYVTEPKRVGPADAHSGSDSGSEAEYDAEGVGLTGDLSFGDSSGADFAEGVGSEGVASQGARLAPPAHSR